MNDVRMDLTHSAMYSIRRAVFVIKTLGKENYPEAMLGTKIRGCGLISSAKDGASATGTDRAQCRSTTC